MIRRSFLIWYFNSPFWSSYKDQHFDQVHYWQIKANFCIYKSPSGRIWLILEHLNVNMLLKISWIFLRGAALGQHVFHLMFCPTIHVFCTDWNSFRNIVDEWGCQKFSKFFKSRRYFLHRRFGFFNFWKSSFIFITCRLLQASPSVWQCLTKFDRSQRNHWRKVWDLFAFAILKLRDRRYIPAWSGRWL